MKKRHTFWAKREFESYIDLCFLNGVQFRSFCYKAFTKKYDLGLKVGEKKKIAITIEEVK